MKRSALLLSAALVLSACGDEGPSIPLMEGQWSGSTSVSGTSVTVDLTLTETDRQVSGSGTMHGGASVAVTVSGSHVHPDVSLTISASGYEDMNFSGEFISDVGVKGELRGSGFNGESLTLYKQ